MRNKFAKRKQKIVYYCHGQFNIDCDNIVLAFEGFKVSQQDPRLKSHAVFPLARDKGELNSLMTSVFQFFVFTA